MEKPMLKSMGGEKGKTGSQVLEFNWSYNPPTFYILDINITV